MMAEDSGFSSSASNGSLGLYRGGDDSGPGPLYVSNFAGLGSLAPTSLGKAPSSRLPSLELFYSVDQRVRLSSFV